jgi:hypothetical protein
MIREDADSLPPLEALLHSQALSNGQRLTFQYRSEDGREEVFHGIVRPGGIEVDGEVHKVSLAAIKCIESTGDQRAINGWFAWETEDGRFLSDLHREWLGLPAATSHRERHVVKFFEFPRERDAVFVFGAGASYADGAPLQRDLVPFILSNEDPTLAESLSGKILADFLADNFAWDEADGYYPSLEQIFGFLDYFIRKQESLSSKYSLADIHLVREALIKAVHHTIGALTQRKSTVYSRFWDHVYETNPNVTAITLNYDSFLENEFLHLYTQGLYLDYCMPLANYEWGDGVPDDCWWVDPHAPMAASDTLDPVVIKLIKLHGSLNWKYCNCCNEVLLTPAQQKVELGSGEPPWRPGGDGMDCPSMRTSRCAREGNPYQTLLVPPSHLKDLWHPVTARLFIEASAELRRARRLVLVGYSLPEADVHVAAILKKSLRPDTEVVVVDINTASDFRSRCRKLSDQVRFLECSFEALVNDPEAMGALLEPRAP